MNEDTTKDLSTDEMLRMILADLADQRIWRAGTDVRLMKIEAFIEDRSRDTQPLLGKIHKEIADTRIEMKGRFDQAEERLIHIETKLDVMTADIMNVRTVQRSLAGRVSEIEQRKY